MSGPPSIRWKAIRWVAFDVAGTLLFADPPVADVYHRVAARRGSTRTPDEVGKRFRTVFQAVAQVSCAGGGEDLLATSDDIEKAGWRRIVAETLDDVDDPFACYEELFAHFGRADSWRCTHEASDVIAKLECAGYGLALASNFDSRLVGIADGIEAIAHIEVRAISSLVGWRKPSSRFYEELVRRCQCAPEEILMVGDDYVNDVAGARAAGLQAVHLCPNRARSGGDAISRLNDLVEHLIA